VRINKATKRTIIILAWSQSAIVCGYEARSQDTRDGKRALIPVLVFTVTTRKWAKKKEMGSTGIIIGYHIFFLTVSRATNSAAAMEQGKKAVPERVQKCGSTGSRMLSVQLNPMGGVRDLSDLVEL